MIGVYDFCGHYDWTFAWLEQRGGPDLVRQYWLQAISQDSQSHAASLIIPGGIPAMQAYWGHTLAEEGAGYTSGPLDDETFRLDMTDCPSRGFLLKNAIGEYSDYCDHCIGWIGPMMQKAGFAVTHEHNHCGQCWWQFRRAAAGADSAPASADDIRNSPAWQSSSSTIHRFEPGQGYLPPEDDSTS